MRLVSLGPPFNLAAETDIRGPWDLISHAQTAFRKGSGHATTWGQGIKLRNFEKVCGTKRTMKL